MPSRLAVTAAALALSLVVAVGSASAIAGGAPSRQGAWPWMAAVVSRGKGASESHFCGGVLIASRWVLTAGHCASPSRTDVDVVIDRADLDSSAGRRVEVDRVVRSPHWKATSAWGGAYSFDLSLLHLARAAGEAPAPLARLHDVPDGTPVWALGFGSLSDGGGRTHVLRQVRLQTIADATCRAHYGSSYAPLTELCAGDLRGGHDTCGGDSGGPLVAGDPAHRLVVAITSWGDGCAKRGVPGVYVSVSSMRPWIDQVTGMEVSAGHRANWHSHAPPSGATPAPAAPRDSWVSDHRAAFAWPLGAMLAAGAAAVALRRRRR